MLNSGVNTCLYSHTGVRNNCCTLKNDLCNHLSRSSNCDCAEVREDVEQHSFLDVPVLRTKVLRCFLPHFFFTH